MVSKLMVKNRSYTHLSGEVRYNVGLVETFLYLSLLLDKTLYFKVLQDMEKALGTQFHNQLITQFVSKRHELGISQMDLDEIIGVARGLVSKWEVGIRKPSGFLFCVWAESLNCNLILENKGENNDGHNKS